MIDISSMTPGRSRDPDNDVMLAIVLMTGGTVAANGSGIPAQESARTECGGSAKSPQPAAAPDFFA